MTITNTHAFVSGKADGADATLVQPSNWNAGHTLTLATNMLLGRATAGTGQVEEIPCTAVARALLAGASQLAMRAALGQMLTADIGALQVTAAQIANNTITAAQLAGITSQAMTLSSIGMNAGLNVGFTASVNSGALTINLTAADGTTLSATNPVQLEFSFFGIGLMVTVASPIPLVIPSGANLGIGVNSTPFRGWIIAINNAGTVELGVVVCSTVTAAGALTLSGAINNEGATVSASAISGSSNTLGTIYAGTGVSNKAFRIIGYLEYAAGLASFGVYGIVPTTLQVFGPGCKKPGEVIQVASNTTTTSGTTSSATFVALTSGQTQAIIPSSAVNPIEVDCRTAISQSNIADSQLQISRGVVAATNLIGNISHNNSTGAQSIVAAVLAHDLPGTVSSTTYALQGKTSAGTISCPSSGKQAYMVVREIMA